MQDIARPQNQKNPALLIPSPSQFPHWSTMIQQYITYSYNSRTYHNISPDIADFIAVPRRSPSELSPLLLAAEHDSLEMLQLLLEAQADPSVQDASGCGAVYIAAQMGHVDVLRRLLECRCSAEGSTETSPLHIARENGFAEVVKLLEDQ